MKTRWVYGILLLVFAVIGIHYNNTQVPNQKIVVQFQPSDSHLENSITLITKQLQEIGVSQIKIQDSEDSQITITYHSDSDVANIESILIKQGLITSANPISSKEDSNSFKVNVSEIYATQNNAWDFEGTLVAEFKEHLDRPLPTKVLTGFFRANENDSKALSDSTVIGIHFNDGLILKSSYQIPEVRAGPLS